MPWGSLSRCVAFDLFFPWAFDCDIYGQYVLEKETILFIFSPE